jgi:hypothetical protein
MAARVLSMIRSPSSKSPVAAGVSDVIRMQQASRRSLFANKSSSVFESPAVRKQQSIVGFCVNTPSTSGNVSVNRSSPSITGSHHAAEHTPASSDFSASDDFNTYQHPFQEVIKLPFLNLFPFMTFLSVELACKYRYIILELSLKTIFLKPEISITPRWSSI